MHLKKIALIIEYEGTRFHGFQAQAQSPTVQEVLEEAIQSFTGEKVRVTCASRTDAGVHAAGQVVSFRTSAGHPPGTFIKALNHFLPADVAAIAAGEIPMGLDVRKAATGREYRYVVLNRPERSPLQRRWAYWVSQPLDVDGMARAAAGLCGDRDFAPFAGSLVPKTSSTRKVLERVEVRRRGELVVFDVAGNSFLHQQVRRMVGTLVKVGLGKMDLDEFSSLVNSRERGVAGPTLPPHGLYLMTVRYREFPPLVPAAVAETQGRNNHGFLNKDL